MLNTILPSVSTRTAPGLDWLVDQLDAHAAVVDEALAWRLLNQISLSENELAGDIEPQTRSYGRRSVVRREHYELLVLTWLPGQGSVAHDHSGSLCGLKVMRGNLTEQLFEAGPDGQVRPTTASQLATGEITVDPGIVIHALGNSATASEMLVTVHLYSPPLPEVRRYAITATPPAPVFLRASPPEIPAIVIIGGGFTGTMTLAHLLRQAAMLSAPVRLILIDRQTALGEGMAYRTNDARHLLNVPAGNMSAWPDRPDDFLDFARATDPDVKPGDFLPRKLFGKYVRQAFLDAAQSASGHVSIQVIRDDAVKLTPNPLASSGWLVETAGGQSICAGQAIITLGHRPPADQCLRGWSGPRHRLVTDPWAALVLSQIGPDEPVLILGSGLTAVDALLTLNHPQRTAPLIVVSRRGLLPQAHARDHEPDADVTALVTPWLDSSRSLTVRELVRSLRAHIVSVAAQGVDWRPVVNALRPFTASIWQRLPLAERARFLRHVRPFWETYRHRMPPAVADQLVDLRARNLLNVTAGTLVSATADSEGINIELSGRGKSGTIRLRVAWVINCTGPDAHRRHSTHPLLRPLIESGSLCGDALGLGLLTDSEGRALDAHGAAHADLLVAWTLRKSTLWESTAVPELRQQAAAIAQIAWQRFSGNGAC